MAVPSSLAEREIPSQPASQPDPVQHLLQLSTAYILTSALWVAAELKIADLIGAESKSVAELARQTNANEDALFRVLRLLATVGILAEAEPQHFARQSRASGVRCSREQRPSSVQGD